MWLGTIVDHQGQPRSPTRLAERLQPFLPTAPRVDQGMVHDVVAVLGAGHCPQQRGEVEGIDAQLREVGHHVDRIEQGEVVGELNSIGRTRRR